MWILQQVAYLNPDHMYLILELIFDSWPYP